MQIFSDSPDGYVQQLPPERRHVIEKLRTAILNHIPAGFEETMSYGSIGYVVPKTLYPKGYHCDPKLPLPFINVASQKGFVALYHMGIYSEPKLLDWFVEGYAAIYGRKPDMGKSCIRFKNLDKIPYELIGELASKITVDVWIETMDKYHK